ncbi:MAG: hypothetical protein H0V70_04510 [Ktedonobacteraceae bacterium]|nr:hypothetical protein [Ktedonobacteraceae bacterium]
MMTSHLSLLIRWSLISALLLLILGVAIGVISSPTLVTTIGAQAWVYLILFVLAVLIYGWFALFRTQARTPAAQAALQTGTLWGLLCAAAWIIELLVANVMSPGGAFLYPVLYYGTAFTGFLIPALSSFLAARRSRSLLSGLQAGLLTAMMGALAIFLASFLFSALLLRAGLSDPQTLREFAHSGLSDLKTYIVSDYLAGMITHLWIGLVTGFFLGLLGDLGGKVLAHLSSS